MTGTPIQNKLADLGTLFAFIRAEPFNKASVFRKWIEAAFEQNSDPAKVKQRLVMLLEAFCLRRTKAVLDLPPLRQYVRGLELSSQEQQQYDNMEAIMMRAIKQRVGRDGKSSMFSLFHATLQLRILCNHGTFQKQFSWRWRSYRDEKDVFGSMRGNESEIKCSGCQQPMPFQGSTWYEGMFEDQCAHVLCSECIEQSMAPGHVSRTRRCPVCMRWNKQAVSQYTQPRGPGSEEAAGIAETNFSTGMASVEHDQEYYFNKDGYSTKMKKLIEDVSVDLWTTKRRV